MIKGWLSLLGMFGVFQAPKERGKGSEVNRFLEEQMLPIRSRGWAGALLILLCKLRAPPPLCGDWPPKSGETRGVGTSPGARAGVGGPES